MDNKKLAWIKIEVLDIAILKGSINNKEIAEELNEIARLLGRDANQVFSGPLVKPGKELNATDD